MLFVENVIPSVVFERDKWICQLCLAPVDQGLSGDDPDGPTVDHIIPLTHGGPHSYENTQLAHRRCNTQKGNRVSGQMALPLTA
jgi:5-methylcytosine-specific restriction endonuclease McrA